MKKTFSHLNRRQALKVGVAGSAALATPLFFVSNANAYTNAPTGDHGDARLQRAADRRLR